MISSSTKTIDFMKTLVCGGDVKLTAQSGDSQSAQQRLGNINM